MNRLAPFAGLCLSLAIAGCPATPQTPAAPTPAASPAPTPTPVSTGTPRIESLQAPDGALESGLTVGRRYHFAAKVTSSAIAWKLDPPEAGTVDHEGNVELKRPGAVKLQLDGPDGPLVRFHLAGVATPAPGTPVWPGAQPSPNYQDPEILRVINAQSDWYTLGPALFGLGVPMPVVDLDRHSIVVATQLCSAAEQRLILTHIEPGEPPVAHVAITALYRSDTALPGISVPRVSAFLTDKLPDTTRVTIDRLSW